MQQNNAKLKQVLSYLKVNLSGIGQGKFTPVSTLTLDSRLADTSTLFLAIFGSQSSGHQYVDKAARNGCKLAFLDTNEQHQHGNVEERHIDEKHTITCLLVHNLHTKLADVAYCFYTGKNGQNQLINELPSITAITGTNGKTSVAALMAQMSSLCQQTCASIGTLGVNLFTNGKQQQIADTINTTPDIISLIGTLALLQSKGCKSVTLEASSHGLAQNRLSKLNVGCAVFTNLTQDHLDYHGTMHSYGHAKRQLLQAQGLRSVVLNADDNESLLWQKDARHAHKVYWFSLSKLNAEKEGCWASNISYSTKGISFTLHAKLFSFEAEKKITTPLIGMFNVANLMAAFTALLVQGLSFEALVKATHQISGVAGRMELFASIKASVLVDYAHTPDALKQALIAARVHTQGKLTCIFGCGGNRDASKRAIMGDIAQQYADNIVLTQDNSRNEDPTSIICDIQQGMRSLNSHQTLNIELDRERAITCAWQTSNASDMILVAGKGHEDYIEINGIRMAYNERDVVRMLTNSNVANPEAVNAQHARGRQ
jgi:UDP-N-acetylmuramoyl-L-alanyl-D-glutamate--2,6-diaminopimelate ligase